MTTIRRPTRTVDASPDPAAPSYLFVGGKGGVGKTTCAAALALRAAAAGQRTLVISTDPAPSLGDAFMRPLGAAPRAIPTRRGSLHAVEIDARRALERWLNDRRETLERVALRGTWLDDEDVTRLLGLSLPGIDEIAALIEIARFGRSGRFDTVVVDTAPTGHTLRMLGMPDTLAAVAGVFDHMQAKHRAMVGVIRGGWIPDRDDEVIAGMEEDARDLHALLRDRSRVQIHWVTLPEPMAIAETLDAVRALSAEQLAVGRIVVNRATPAPPSPCGWCSARRVLEARAIRTLTAALPDVPAIVIGARDEEPRGVRALTLIGAAFESAPRRPDRPPGQAKTWRAAGPARNSRVVADLATSATRLLMFGGKGGVGKTTCAAAAAIELAHRSPARRVLLLSTDPAHSLADALGVTVSDDARAIARGPSTSLRAGPRNLRVRELDAARGLRSLRARYAAAIDALFDRLSRGSGLTAGGDRVVMRELFELAPPGIDELAAVIDVTDALDGDDGEDRYDLIVMDTAPSGHALRLLEMPAVVQDWAKALMSLLLKYQAVGGIGELGTLLVKLSQGIGRLRSLLTDRARTTFVAVTRPAALPRAETVRLITRLTAMHIHVPVVVVNAVGRGTCARCRKGASAETREVTRLMRAVGGSGARRRGIVIAPASLPPPHGVAALRAWARQWHGEH